MPSFDRYEENNLASTIDDMVRTANTDQAVANLSSDELDVCMRYIYKGLESGDNSNALLKWHESVFNKAGLGSIIRALTFRNKTKDTPSKGQQEDEDD